MPTVKKDTPTLLTVRDGAGRIVQQETYNEPLPDILYRADKFNQALDSAQHWSFLFALPCWHPQRLPIVNPEDAINFTANEFGDD